MKDKMINAPQEVIESIYFKDDWRKIVKLRNNVRIPTKNPLSLDDYIHDQPNSVWELIDRDGIRVYDKDSYLDKILENPTSVLDNPSDLFFVDENTKKIINGNVGVWLSSSKSASTEPLTICTAERLRKGEEFTWDKLLREDMIHSIPSNSLILVDRYMFTNFRSGVDNLMDILSCILPETMNGSYHVLLVTDEEQLLLDNSIYDIDSAVKEIQGVIPSLERPYKIILEILLVKRLQKAYKGYRRTKSELALKDFYAETHDRHIISNYFIVTAEHGLSAVEENRSGDLVASFKQTLYFESIYSGIENKYQDLNSLPIKACDDFVKAINTFINSDNPDCKYYVNSKLGDVRNIINRLL